MRDFLAKDLSCFVSCEMESGNNSLEIPIAYFSLQNPQANLKNNFTESFWRAGKVMFPASMDGCP